VRPRRLVGTSGRPLNFTVRFRMRPPLTLALAFAAALRLGVALAQSETHVDIRILADSTCLVNELHVPCADVGAKLHELGTPSSATIRVHPEKDAKYEAVAAALDSLMRAGFPPKLDYVNVGPK
jgi:biopolymer transport protein ExbD